MYIFVFDRVLLTVISLAQARYLSVTIMHFPFAIENEGMMVIQTVIKHQFDYIWLFNCHHIM